MSLNPNDDNFVIELEAGGGYGIATCKSRNERLRAKRVAGTDQEPYNDGLGVDDNCYCDIILPPCSRFNDGGKSIGLGDLDAYAVSM
jgi:hypothetical protein